MLRPGITGFDASEHISPKQFKAACHAVVRTLKGDVQDFRSCPGQHSRNYHLARLSFMDTTLVVVCNAYFPYVAFAEPAEEVSPELGFVDNADAARAFHEVGGFRVLFAKDLQRPPTKSELAQLTETERDEVKYWRPQSLGEVVFNHWD